jgi:hypothetical protein
MLPDLGRHSQDLRAPPEIPRPSGSGLLGGPHPRSPAGGRVAGSLSKGALTVHTHPLDGRILDSGSRTPTARPRRLLLS